MNTVIKIVNVELKMIHQIVAAVSTLQAEKRMRKAKDKRRNNESAIEEKEKVEQPSG